MYSVANRVGRLVEIRIWSPVTIEETEAWSHDHDAVVAAVRGDYVCLVDLVDATVFPQDVVDAYVRTMRDEPRLLRTGVLLAQSPILGLQIQRMIREAANPARRAFRDQRSIRLWLGEVLRGDEITRLDQLLERAVS